ncbi:MAG: hypothetical protein A2W91_04155 [Bacteroidetes bacterium GWF2_38_335]|nr:MAG: hypothetical protein A2W91_04155 [Bacteroidetes bacterium GWF2_38_335]OFY79144.1 MAG: hypothetical protein A2281_03490 [Bacteroidetes bacterium RIFOXYA12_FULL_38_20]HBS88769.1 hypothetical protein [Bacteroidales bacterium]
MMKNVFSGIVLIVLTTLCSVAQTTYVKQLILAEGTGGTVYVSSYDPESGERSIFDSIQTGYAQWVFIEDHFAYVAATDSIVKYDIDTYERVDETYMTHLHELHVFGDHLYVGRWLDAGDGVYLKVLNKNDLSQLIFEVPEIDEPTFGIVFTHDSVYVAIYGGYGSTSGKLAVVDPVTQSFVRFIDFGENGQGIGDIFTDDYNIYMVNETFNWADDTVGSIATYNLSTGEVTFDFYEEIITRGYALNYTALFTLLNGNIAVYNLYSGEYSNTNLIAGPGGYDAVSSVVLDRINSKLYVATTDYYSYGEGNIYDLSGNSLGTFDVGISTDAMDIDYRTETGISEKHNAITEIYPNPAVDYIRIKTVDGFDKLTVSDLSGRQIIQRFNGTENEFLSLSSLPVGSYIIGVFTNKNVSYHELIKF